MFIFTEEVTESELTQFTKENEQEGEKPKRGFTISTQIVFDTETGIKYIFEIVDYSFEKSAKYLVEVITPANNSTIKYTGDNAIAFWMQLSYKMNMGDNAKHPERNEVIRKMRGILKQEGGE